MRLGIFAKTFSRERLEESLDAVAATGLRVMQFNLALAGGASLPDAIPGELAARIRAAAEERGLTMAGVSGTYNMAHPDAGVRADGARRLGVLIAAAPALGTRVVTLCTGTRDASDMWRRHPDNGTPEAWRDTLASLEAALAHAEAHGVTLAFEPEHANVVDSAAAGRRLLGELRSPHLKVVLDPANLGPGPDTLRAAFDLLGGDLVLAHAKDIWRGEVDYELYFALLAQAGDVPLILHGLAEDEVARAVAFLRR